MYEYFWYFFIRLFDVFFLKIFIAFWMMNQSCCFWILMIYSKTWFVLKIIHVLSCWKYCPVHWHRMFEFWNCEVRRLTEGGAYFKVREMSNIKYQNLVFFSFKIRTKHNFSRSMNQIQWKNLNINNIFNVLLFAY